MSTFCYNLQLAKKLIEEFYLEDSFFDKIYPFTNENIDGYIDSFDLKDRTLLTVGSSCDQVINAVLSDAKEVTLLDKNQFARYYYFLKLAAINTFSREDFIKYFKYNDYPKTFKYNYSVFDYDMFKRLEKELSALDFISYMFWLKLYESYKPIDIRLNLFHRDEVRTDVLKHFNRYLRDDDSYKETRRKLNDRKPIFLVDDVMCPKVHGTFDNIWLSNIASYSEKYEEIKLIIHNMYNLLNEGGLLEACYLYEINDEDKYKDEWEIVYNKEYIMELLKDFNPDEISFTCEKVIKQQLAGYKEYSDVHDSIIICKKLKK